jgi:hypothetical protein
MHTLISFYPDLKFCFIDVHIMTRLEKKKQNIFLFSQFFFPFCKNLFWKFMKITKNFENCVKLEFFFLQLDSTLIFRSLEKNFFDQLFINSSIFGPCQDSPGQLGKDSQCEISRTGHLGQASRTAGANSWMVQAGQEREDRMARTWQKDRAAGTGKWDGQQW